MAHIYFSGELKSFIKRIHCLFTFTLTKENRANILVYQDFRKLGELIAVRDSQLKELSIV